MENTSPAGNFDWEDILDALEEEKCILFLGPGVFRTANGDKLENQLHQELDAFNPAHPHIRSFYKEDGFFLFKEDHYKRKVIRRIKKFFGQDHPDTESLLAKLARIPFHIIFTLTPDGLLSRVFDQLGLPFHHDFYNKNHQPQPYIQPQAKRPLLYNMLGYIEEYDSLVLTHNDLFDYLNSIFAGKSMQNELRQQLKQAHSYIFLGLPYEKWYLQLLLRVLYLHAPELVKLERYASNPITTVKKELKSLFEDQFNIEFVPTDPTSFITELYKHCEQRGQLRELPEDAINIGLYRQQLRQARTLLGENKILEGVEILQTVMEANRPLCNKLLDELTLQERNFRNLNARQINGLATERERVELNQAVFALINLISQTENCLAL